MEENALWPILHFPVFRLALIFHFRLLTLVAYYNHPDLDVARARSGIAEAAIITAGARPNPILRMIPEFSANPPSGVSPWTIGPVSESPLRLPASAVFSFRERKNYCRNVFWADGKFFGKTYRRQRE